jgi:putative membrane protein (TIGR04086 family)
MNWKAITIGLISYPLLWGIWFSLSPQYEHQSPDTYLVVLSVFYISIPFFSGFIAAHVSRIKGILHGLVLGIILTIISLLGWYFLDILTMNMLLSLAGIVLLATAGGALSQGLIYLLEKQQQ